MSPRAPTSSDACVSQRNAQASPHCPYRGEGGKGGQRRGLRDMPLSYRLFCGGSRDKRIQPRKLPLSQRAACGSPSRFITKSPLERQVCLYFDHEFGDVIKSVSLLFAVIRLNDFLSCGKCVLITSFYVNRSGLLKKNINTCLAKHA